MWQWCVATGTSREPHTGNTSPNWQLRNLIGPLCMWQIECLSSHFPIFTVFSPSQCFPLALPHMKLWKKYIFVKNSILRDRTVWKKHFFFVVVTQFILHLVNRNNTFKKWLLSPKPKQSWEALQPKWSGGEKQQSLDTNQLSNQTVYPQGCRDTEDSATTGRN